MTDGELLRALLASDRLGESERQAFADMLGRLEEAEGRYQHAYGLSKAQRQWAEERHAKLELDAEEGSQNLWSSNKVPRGIPDPSARHFESLPRPKAPPGREVKEEESESEPRIRGHFGEVVLARGLASPNPPGSHDNLLPPMCKAKK